MLKKLRLFNVYRKKINSIKIELSQKFNTRVDRAMRLYTVINIPEELIGEAYALKKSDIDKISENYIRQFYVELGETLNKNGLMELFDLYDMKKVDKYSYLLVIGFKLFKSYKLYNTIYYIITPLLVISLLSLFFLI